MAIQHRDIIDAERHEPKGASTATAGQVLSAIGDGSTVFVTPTSLTNITVTDVFAGAEITAQNPSAVDTPLQVLFGTASSNGDISLSSGGTIIFNTSGFFHVTVNLNMGRGSTAGLSKMLYRFLVNDVMVDTVQMVTLPTDGEVIPCQYTLSKNFSATSTLKVEIMRDSTGVNTGGLVTIDPVLAGWGVSPSASIKIQKVTGAV